MHIIVLVYFVIYASLLYILYHNHVCFITADDKHKIPIGEGVATSTGVRNRKSIVSTDATLFSQNCLL